MLKFYFKQKKKFRCSKTIHTQNNLFQQRHYNRILVTPQAFLEIVPNRSDKFLIIFSFLVFVIEILCCHPPVLRQRNPGFGPVTHPVGKPGRRKAFCCFRQQFQRFPPGKQTCRKFKSRILIAGQKAAVSAGNAAHSIKIKAVSGSNCFSGTDTAVQNISFTAGLRIIFPLYIKSNRKRPGRKQFIRRR